MISQWSRAPSALATNQRRRRKNENHLLHAVSKASIEDKLALVNKVDAFIFDCDGVIWRGDSVIEGVPETLDWLRSMVSILKRCVSVLMSWDCTDGRLEHVICPGGVGRTSAACPCGARNIGLGTLWMPRMRLTIPCTTWVCAYKFRGLGRPIAPH